MVDCKFTITISTYSTCGIIKERIALAKIDAKFIGGQPT